MGGEKYKSVIGEGGGVIGTGCGGGQVWWCVLSKTNMEVPEGCICQINVLQWTLEGVNIIVRKYIRWTSVPLTQG